MGGMKLSPGVRMAAIWLCGIAAVSAFAFIGGAGVFALVSLAVIGLFFAWVMWDAGRKTYHEPRDNFPRENKR